MAKEPIETQDDRLKKQDMEARISRSEEDRDIAENRELTDDMRLELLRGMGLQTILPDIPPIPGFHVVWLSTANGRDSIPARARLGYTPVRPSDVPSFHFGDTSVQRGTQWGDCIMINEMIAYKLPMRLYQAYMEELHHKEPLRQESALAETARRIRREAQGIKADVEMYDGLEELEQPVPKPIFT